MEVAAAIRAEPVEALFFVEKKQPFDRLRAMGGFCPRLD